MTADEERIEISEQVDPAVADFLDDRLNAFNFEATGYTDGRGLSILIRDPDGAILAGLHGFSWGGMCKVRLLWVRADARGQGWGSRLLAAAEAEARARGCRRITLSTHSFQAPDFYRARGYEIVGTVEDFPVGHRSYTLVKQLETADK